MPFAAISYDIKPGYTEEIAEIFAPKNFRRVDSPVLAGEDGETAGRLLSTGLFIQDTAMVRVIEFEGDIARLAPHMARQEGVQEAEQKLKPYLATPRETSTAAGFTNHLGIASMRCLQQRSLRDLPAGNMAALRYKVKPGHEDDIAEVFAGVQRDARPTLRGTDGQETGVIAAVALFVRGSDMIRMVKFEGEIDDVARYMAQRGPRPEMEQKLAPFMDEDRHVDTPEDFVAQFKKNTMRRISYLSVADLPANAS